MLCAAFTSSAYLFRAIHFSFLSMSVMRLHCRSIGPRPRIQQNRIQNMGTESATSCESVNNSIISVSLTPSRDPHNSESTNLVTFSPNFVSMISNTLSQIDVNEMSVKSVSPSHANHHSNCKKRMKLRSMRWIDGV